MQNFYFGRMLLLLFHSMLAAEALAAGGLVPSAFESASAAQPSNVETPSPIKKTIYRAMSQRREGHEEDLKLLKEVCAAEKAKTIPDIFAFEDNALVAVFKRFLKNSAILPANRPIAIEGNLREKVAVFAQEISNKFSEEEISIELADAKDLKEKLVGYKNDQEVSALLKHLEAIESAAAKKIEDEERAEKSLKAEAKAREKEEDRKRAQEEERQRIAIIAAALQAKQEEEKRLELEKEREAKNAADKLAQEERARKEQKQADEEARKGAETKKEDEARRTKFIRENSQLDSLRSSRFSTDAPERRKSMGALPTKQLSTTLEYQQPKELSAKQSKVPENIEPLARKESTLASVQKKEKEGKKIAASRSSITKEKEPRNPIHKAKEGAEPLFLPALTASNITAPSSPQIIRDDGLVQLDSQSIVHSQSTTLQKLVIKRQLPNPPAGGQLRKVSASPTPPAPRPVTVTAHNTQRSTHFNTQSTTFTPDKKDKKTKSYYAKRLAGYSLLTAAAYLLGKEIVQYYTEYKNRTGILA